MPDADKAAQAAVEGRSSTRTAAGIASKAADLVGGDREKQHGSKSDNFSRIATMWDAYMRIRREPAAPIDALDVGHLMALMKLARTQSGSFNIDDYIDLVGYGACAGEVAQDVAKPGVHLLKNAAADKILMDDVDADADGWIEWPGGKCPVDGDVQVEVKFQARPDEPESPCRAAGLRWEHWRSPPSGGDIVAYRVVTP